MKPSRRGFGHVEAGCEGTKYGNSCKLCHCEAQSAAAVHIYKDIALSEPAYRCLGIDPGCQIAGYGIIEAENKKWEFIAAGSIRMQGDMSVRLKKLFVEICEVVEIYKPQVVSIEQAFVHINPSSALKLGQARGVAMAAVLSKNLPFYEYAPRLVKQAVVGKGSATKIQVQHMIQTLLNIPTTLQADAADALAIALCHCHMQTGLAAMIGYTKPKRRSAKRNRTKWEAYDIKTNRNSS